MASSLFTKRSAFTEWFQAQFGIDPTIDPGINDIRAKLQSAQALVAKYERELRVAEDLALTRKVAVTTASAADDQYRF